MELLYVNALKENNLSVSDLPEDAKVGIYEITKVIKGFQMVERKGKKPTPSAIKKLKTLDKWVYYEILDYLNDTDKNDDELPMDADEILDDLEPAKKKEEEVEIEPDYEGLQIDSELERLIAEGKKDFTIDELRKLAPKTYKNIWDSYEHGEENGVVTSKYSLIENDDELFVLNKK